MRFSSISNTDFNFSAQKLQPIAKVGCFLLWINKIVRPKNQRRRIRAIPLTDGKINSSYPSNRDAISAQTVYHHFKFTQSSVSVFNTKDYLSNILDSGDVMRAITNGGHKDSHLIGSCRWKMWERFQNHNGHIRWASTYCALPSWFTDEIWRTWLRVVCF